MVGVIEDVAEVARWAKGLEVRVVRPRLQQQHRHAGVLRQAGRQDAPGRTPSNDDVVVPHGKPLSPNGYALSMVLIVSSN